MPLATYHNHSTYSDGSRTVAQVVDRARALGVEELGLSDHYVLHPDGLTPVWAMHPDRLGEYVADVAAYRDHRDPVVRVGLEVDWFPGHGGALAAALAPHRFDYLIGSVHEIDGFPLDFTAGHWERLDPGERDEMWRSYWIALRSMAESGLFDIVGHLDLPKKFGHRPLVDLSTEIDAALDAIAAAGLAVEFNAAGWHKPCAEAYPSDALLRACHRRGIPALYAADAHHPDHLLMDAGRAARQLWGAGYREVARFCGRQRGSVPLER
jgi:histidinol-phosphatase (PHP family)